MPGGTSYVTNPKSGPLIPAPFNPITGMIGFGGGGFGGGGYGGGPGGGLDPLRKRRLQGAAPSPGGGYDYQQDPYAYVSGYKGPENILSFRDKVNKGGGDWTPDRYQQVSQTMKSLMGGRYGPGRGTSMGGFGESMASDPIKKLLMARYGGGI